MERRRAAEQLPDRWYLEGVDMGTEPICGTRNHTRTSIRRSILDRRSSLGSYGGDCAGFYNERTVTFLRFLVCFAGGVPYCCELPSPERRDDEREDERSQEGYLGPKGLSSERTARFVVEIASSACGRFCGGIRLSGRLKWSPPNSHFPTCCRVPRARSCQPQFDQ